jgi:glycosyltransferase involved in cell wall biosynthesis
MSNAGPGRRLRVLTLVDGIGTFGGGERLARQITTHLDPERFETTLCVSRWEPEPLHEPALEELRAAGVSFLGLRRGSRLQLSPWRRLSDYLREWPADVLHTHKIGSNAWGALLGPRAGVPVFVAHEHTWSYEGKPYRMFLDRNLIARRADAFVAVSREDQRRMIALERIPHYKTRFIANGIATSRPPDPSRDVRAELGIDPSQPVVGTVATIRPQKALDVLLRAAAQIREAVPEVRVLVAGGSDDPEEERRLRRLLAELELEATVTLLGARPDVPELLAAFDVAALSSDFEGSPLSLLEYMQAAKPVVATRVGGVPDIVEDGVTGLLVEPRDPAALAAAISGLLGDPARAAQIGEAGRERQLRDFTLAAMAARVGDLYEELFAARRGSGAS